MGSFTEELTLDTLEAALQWRTPEKGLFCHSDSAASMRATSIWQHSSKQVSFAA